MTSLPGNNDAEKHRSIDAMFNPRSIAIIGATERPGYSGRFLQNLIQTGSIARLYPVNPSRETVFGVRCYPSVLDLPEPVDLVAIILPSAQVVPAFSDAVKAGAGSGIIISAGFAELATDEGRARQAALRDLARGKGVRLCGPNCLGLANVAASSWTTPSTRIAPEMRDMQPGIGLVSQSGATAYRPLLGMAQDRRIAFRYLVATGNEADLESSDFLQYMLGDPEVRVVAAVIEGFKDGDKFVQTAKMALEAGKPLVVLKIGRTEAGARGANSHTAAMTGSDAVQHALFQQKGVIRVDDYDELLETAAMFRTAKAPRGRRAGAISESGGMGSFLADKCAEEGLEVPKLSEATRGKLLEIMGERGSAANPADLTSFGTGPAFPAVMDHILDESEQDLVIMSSVGGAMQADTIIAAAKRTEKPILFVWTGSIGETPDIEALQRLRASDVPLFYLPAKAAKAARRLVDYHRTRRLFLAEQGGHSSAPADAGPLDQLRRQIEIAGARALTEHESKRALNSFGIQVNDEMLCRDESEALAAAERLGYPVVLKVVSSDIMHKTEVGGVRLGIAGAAEVVSAYRAVLGSVRAHAPEATIEGVLLAPMISDKVELIVGTSLDPLFGPVLMLGLGGIFAEALAATAHRLCPINAREARDMIEDVRGLPQILAGFRGTPKADIDALVGVLVRVSEFAIAAKAEIASLDINPLAVLPHGRGAVALDALLIPKLPQHATDDERRDETTSPPSGGDHKPSAVRMIDAVLTANQET